MWEKFLKRHFSHYKWCRKYIGGYWECWYIDIIHVDIWFDVNKNLIFDKYGFRPGCGHGTPYCEYYPLEFFDYRTNFDKQYYKRQQKLERICS